MQLLTVRISTVSISALRNRVFLFEVFVNYSPPICMNALSFLGAFKLIAIRKIADGKRHTDLMEARKLRFDSHAKFMR